MKKMYGILTASALLAIAGTAQAQLIVAVDEVDESVKSTVPGSGTYTDLFTPGVEAAGILAGSGDAPEAMAFDDDNKILYWNHSDELYSWDVNSDTHSLLGTLTAPDSGNQSISALAYDNVNDILYSSDTLNSTTSGGVEGIYSINIGTLASTLVADASAGGVSSENFGGLGYSPATGLLYANSDGGSGDIYTIDPGTGTYTFLANYPAGASSDSDGLAVGVVGGETILYLVPDNDSGEDIGVYNATTMMDGASFAAPALTGPGGSGVFSAGAWGPSLFVFPDFDLNTSVTVDMSGYTVGDTITATVTINNPGTAAVTGVSVTVDGGADITYVSDTASSSAPGAGTSRVYTVGGIAGEDFATFDITFDATVGGGTPSVDLTALALNEIDPNPANDLSSSGTFSIFDPSNVKLYVTTDDSTIGSGNGFIGGDAVGGYDPTPYVAEGILPDFSDGLCSDDDRFRFLLLDGSDLYSIPYYLPTQVTLLGSLTEFGSGLEVSGSNLAEIDGRVFIADSSNTSGAEEGFYEIDLATLECTQIRSLGNIDGLAGGSSDISGDFIISGFDIYDPMTPGDLSDAEIVFWDDDSSKDVVRFGDGTDDYEDGLWSLDFIGTGDPTPLAVSPAFVNPAPAFAGDSDVDGAAFDESTGLLHIFTDGTTDEFAAVDPATWTLSYTYPTPWVNADSQAHGDFTTLVNNNPGGPAHDLSISVSESADPVLVPGTTLSWTYTVFNFGPGASPVTTLELDYPATETFDAGNTTPGFSVVDADTISYSIPSIPFGGSASFTVSVTTVSTGTTVSSSGTMSTSVDDYNNTNDSVTEDTGLADITGLKLFAATNDSSDEPIAAINPDTDISLDWVPATGTSDNDGDNQNLDGLAADDATFTLYGIFGANTYRWGYFSRVENFLGTIDDDAFSATSTAMEGIAFQNGMLYAVRNFDSTTTGAEGVYVVDPATLEADLLLDLSADDLDWDMTCIAPGVDSTKLFIGQDDDSNLSGLGVFEFDLNTNTISFLSAYPSILNGVPDGTIAADVDGMAYDPTGQRLFLMIDEPGEFGVMNVTGTSPTTLSAGTNITSPWTASQTAGGAAWAPGVFSPPVGFNFVVSGDVADDFVEGISEGIDFSFTVINDGPDATPMRDLVIVLDPGLIFDSVNSTPGGVEAPAGTITYSLPPLAVGGNIVIDVTATTATPGVYAANATIDTTGDLIASNNAASASAEIIESAELDLTIVEADCSNTPLNPLDTTTINIEVLNNGPDTANNVVVDFTVNGLNITGSSATLVGNQVQLGSITSTSTSAFTVTVENTGDFTVPTLDALVSSDADDPSTSDNDGDISFLTTNTSTVPDLKPVRHNLEDIANPLSNVDGLPGFQFGRSGDPFGQIWADASGARFVMKADVVDAPFTSTSTTDEVLFVGTTQPFSLTPVAQEGVTLLGAETLQNLDSTAGINASGAFQFSGDTDATDDDVLVSGQVGVPGLTVELQQGQVIFNDPFFSPTYTAEVEQLTAYDIRSDGTFGYRVEYVQGSGDDDSNPATNPPAPDAEITSSDDNFLYEQIGATRYYIAREGFDLPGASLDAYESFPTSTGERYSMSQNEPLLIADPIADPQISAWSLVANLQGPTNADEALVVSGDVMLREGSIISDGFGPLFAAPVLDIEFTESYDDNIWYSYGSNREFGGSDFSNDVDWAVRGQGSLFANVEVLAQTGDPIEFPTNPTGDLIDDTEFSDGFFGIYSNRRGDYLLLTLTDRADPLADAVLLFYDAVANTRTVIARQGEAIDMNNNGVFDDDAFLRIWRNDRFILTDTRLAYFAVEVQDAAGFCASPSSGGTTSTEALIRLQLPGYCVGDWNGDGLTAVGDVLDFLSAYAAGDLTADISGDGILAVGDILDFLAAWAAGCTLPPV